MPARNITQPPIFVRKIMGMLNAPSAAPGKNKYEDYMAWTPAGDAFCIFDIEAFITLVLFAEGFKTTKIASFKKQLNNYGFSVSNNEISHPLFRRDDPALALDIVKGAGSAKKLYPKKKPEGRFVVPLYEQKEEEQIEKEQKDKEDPIATSLKTNPALLERYATMNTDDLVFDWAEPVP